MNEENTFHILIIDDSITVRAFFEEVFAKSPGFKAEFAPNGAAAVELFKQRREDGNPFVFVLTDVNMPGMDGFATIDALKEINPDLKTGMITGFNVDDYIKMALDRGVFNIICKMDAPSEIVKTVHNLITGHGIFGIHNYLAPGTKTLKVNVTDTNLLKSAVKEILDFASEKLNEDKQYGLKTGLVEMGTNAIYHAYGYEKGSQVKLKESEEVVIEYGMDHEKLAVDIIDVSGSLTKEKVLSQLNKGINPTQEDLIAAGGRGLYLTRFLCDKMIINIDLKKKTEMILIMYFNQDYQDSKPLLINQF